MDIFSIFFKMKVCCTMYQDPSDIRDINFSKFGQEKNI